MIRQNLISLQHQIQQQMLCLHQAPVQAAVLIPELEGENARLLLKRQVNNIICMRVPKSTQHYQVFTCMTAMLLDHRLDSARQVHPLIPLYQCIQHCSHTTESMVLLPNFSESDMCTQSLAVQSSQCCIFAHIQIFRFS